MLSVKLRMTFPYLKASRSVLSKNVHSRCGSGKPRASWDQGGFHCSLCSTGFLWGFFMPPPSHSIFHFNAAGRFLSCFVLALCCFCRYVDLSCLIPPWGLLVLILEECLPLVVILFPAPLLFHFVHRQLRAGLAKGWLGSCGALLVSLHVF